MKNKGFTLIEIIAYMVIISIIGVIAIPSYRTIKHAKFKKDVRNVINDIRYVKDMTYLYNQVCRIEFEKDGYKIVDTENKILKKYKFSNETYFTDYELNRGRKKVNYMSYSLSGNAIASGTLALSNSSNTLQKKISIVPVTGRVLMIDE